MCYFGVWVECLEWCGVVLVVGGVWCGLRLFLVCGFMLLLLIDEVGWFEDVCFWMLGLFFVGDLGGERFGFFLIVIVGELVVWG